MDYNRVILTGRLTKDPELRYSGGGKAVVQFGLAVNARRQNAGSQSEETSFFDIVVFGNQAEVCKKYLTKGRSVLVEGRLRQRTWTSEDGQKRRKVEIIANRVHFIGTAQKEAQSIVEPVEDVPAVEDALPDDEEDIPF